MKFKVLSEREIKDFYTIEKHIVISVRSPKEIKAILPNQNSRLATLFLTFHDLDRRYKDAKYRLMTCNDAKKILDFVNKYKDRIDLIICQCEAGISRSAGIAGALSKLSNNDDAIFFKVYLPNMLVYRLILEEGYKRREKDENN